MRLVDSSNGSWTYTMCQALWLGAANTGMDETWVLPSKSPQPKNWPNEKYLYAIFAFYGSACLWLMFLFVCSETSLDFKFFDGCLWGTSWGPGTAKPLEGFRGK